MDPDRDYRRRPLAFRLELGADLELIVTSAFPGPAQVQLLGTAPRPLAGHVGPIGAGLHCVGALAAHPGEPLRIEGLPAGRAQLCVSHPQARVHVQRVFLMAGERASVRVTLEPVEALRGIVRSADQPVAGARVVLEAHNRGQAMFAAFAIGPDAATRQVLDHPAPAVQITHTDAAGRFVLGCFDAIASERYLTVTGRDGTRLAVTGVEKGQREIAVDCVTDRHP